MNIFLFLFLLWLGLYGPIMNLLKQAIFQGKSVLSNPTVYLTNPRFLVSVVGLAVFAQVVWIAEGLIREKMNLSTRMGYGALIVAPISVVANLVVLWLSEQYLSDKIIWWAAGLMALGSVLSMIGGAYLLKGT